MSDVGRYRRLYVNEWHDPRFRALDDAARVVRLYVSAGPQTTSAGCFRLSTAVAVEDLGGSSDDFERRLEAVCEAFAWDWDPLTRVIWVTNWLEINPPASPNVVRSWAKLLKNVPDCDVKGQAIHRIGESLKKLPASFREPWLDLSKTFSISKSDSKSEPKSDSKTNQGTGNRDQRSGKQRTGALRAGAKNEDTKTTPRSTNGASLEATGPLVTLARETLRQTNGKTDDLDLLVDTLQYLEARATGGHTSPRADVVAALNIALAEKRTGVQ